MISLQDQFETIRKKNVLKVNSSPQEIIDYFLKLRQESFAATDCGLNSFPFEHKNTISKRTIALSSVTLSLLKNTDRIPNVTEKSSDNLQINEPSCPIKKHLEDDANRYLINTKVILNNSEFGVDRSDSVWKNLSISNIQTNTIVCESTEFDKLSLEEETNRDCKNKTDVIPRTFTNKEVPQKIKEQSSIIFKDECSKTEKEKAISFLKENGISCFYHFTDRRNISVIKSLGGLYSWDWLYKNKELLISFNLDWNFYSSSWELDKKSNLEDFVRLSFCKSHPMAFNKWNEYKNDEDYFDPVLLKISLNVINEDMFISNMNAVDKNAEYKKGFSSLEIVNYDAVKLEKCRSDDPNFKYRQAEIMIHRTVPIEFIMNIDSPYEFSFNSFKPLPKKLHWISS